jgi:isopenicillin N synthase-like dioxygenase
MATQKPTEFIIPTVDLSPYLQDPTSAAADAIVTEIRNACATSGFFQLVGHGVSKSLQQQAFAAAKVLFSLPDEEKRKLSGTPGRGYEILGTQFLEPGKKADLKEVSPGRYRHVGNLSGNLELTRLSRGTSSGARL